MAQVTNNSTRTRSRRSGQSRIANAGYDDDSDARTSTTTNPCIQCSNVNQRLYEISERLSHIEALLLHISPSNTPVSSSNHPINIDIAGRVTSPQPSSSSTVGSRSNNSVGTVLNSTFKVLIAILLLHVEKRPRFHMRPTLSRMPHPE